MGQIVWANDKVVGVTSVLRVVLTYKLACNEGWRWNTFGLSFCPVKSTTSKQRVQPMSGSSKKPKKKTNKQKYQQWTNITLFENYQRINSTQGHAKSWILT